MANFPKRRFFSNSLPTPGGGGGSGDMILANAQTSTGKKTFSNAGTIAGINIGNFAVDPSTSLTNGDLWYNSTNNTYNGRISGSTAIFPMTAAPTTANRIPYYVTANGILTSNPNFTFDGTTFTGGDFIATASTKTFGTPTQVATTQVLTVNGTNANVGLSIIPKGTGQISINNTAGNTIINGSFAVSTTNDQCSYQVNAITAQKKTALSVSSFGIYGADGIASNVNGGDVIIFGGSGFTTGNTNAGNVEFQSGVPNGTGLEGALKIQTRATGLIGFWNVAPIARPTTAFAGSAAFVANAGTAINTLSTFDGYTIAQIIRIIRTLGLLT